MTDPADAPNDPDVDRILVGLRYRADADDRARAKDAALRLGARHANLRANAREQIAKLQLELDGLRTMTETKKTEPENPASVRAVPEVELAVRCALVESVIGFPVVDHAEFARRFNYLNACQPPHLDQRHLLYLYCLELIEELKLQGVQP